MYIQSRTFSIVYKLVLVVSGILGLLLTFGVFNGRFNLRPLSYFTVLSNLLCVVYFISDLLYLIKNRYDKDETTWNPTLKGIATMSITVTFLVAHFLLGARFEMGSSSGISMLLVHYVVPVMTIADWLLFDKKGHITKASPVIWTIGPLAYFVYTMVVVQMGGICPYPFIDVNRLGWRQVVVNVSVLTLFFITLGYLSLAVEKILIKIDGRQQLL